MVMATDDAIPLQGVSPSRVGQVSTLCQLIATADQALPAAIHIHDTSNSASTLGLVKNVLWLARQRSQGYRATIVVDPLTCPSPRLVWGHILASLETSRDGLNWEGEIDQDSGKADGSMKTSFATMLLDDSVDSFLYAFQQCISQHQKTSEDSIQSQKSIVIFVKSAERMRDLWPEAVVEALYKLGELCETIGNVCILSLSHLGTSHFRSSRPGVANRGPLGAITIPLGRLGKEDFIVEVGKDFDSMREECEITSMTTADIKALFHGYLSIAYDAFSSDTRDLGEMRLLACCAWYPFIRPLKDGRAASMSLQQLVIRSPGLFQDALDNLLTRKEEPAEWTSRACEGRSALTSKKMRARDPRLVWPLSPALAYLVLASFLASYNPARLDVRYFVRDESALLVQADTGDAIRRRRKRGGALFRKPRRKARKQRHAGDGESNVIYNRQALLGPRPFTYDRLLSIFQALVTEADLDTRDNDASTLWELKSKSITVTNALNQLLRLGLIVRTSLTERLDVTMTLRTNVTREVATEVSKQARFDLDEWLWDWA